MLNFAIHCKKKKKNTTVSLSVYLSLVKMLKTSTLSLNMISRLLLLFILIVLTMLIFFFWQCWVTFAIVYILGVHSSNRELFQRWREIARQARFVKGFVGLTVTMPTQKKSDDEQHTNQQVHTHRKRRNKIKEVLTMPPAYTHFTCTWNTSSIHLPK